MMSSTEQQVLQAIQTECPALHVTTVQRDGINVARLHDWSGFVCEGDIDDDLLEEARGLQAAQAAFEQRLGHSVPARVAPY